MMNWPGRELAPRRAPSAQAFGAGRLKAPAPIWSMSTGAIPATADRTSPTLTACISGKSQP